MNNFLYHITKEKYLSSILLNGLIINSNKNGFVKKTYLKNYIKKYGLQPIFLTNDFSFIIETQLTDNFIRDCYILKIKSDDLKLEDECEYLNKNWNLYYNSFDSMRKNISKYLDKSFISRENIDRKLIYECSICYK